ncbi:SAM-dependent methyltransferase [Pseudonocardia acaciae]|uniref:SAM-dependent methyltransferase n=1 Tax=Pseudonocardia acaciae TaxID=551276 RepID=UPI0004911D86|nr:SAM-dependent methyltransferase [Pseudonocardia acaciae]
MSDFYSREIDTTKPSAARLYDYYLGGTHNYPVDRAFAERIRDICPFAWDMARDNRDFLRRAVRFALGNGIRQFIDIGSGVPTVGNVHEAAHQIAPETRVVYVDNDTEAVVTSQDMLRDSTVATAIPGDLRHPDTILDHPRTARLIDFDRPVGLLIVAVFHFVSPRDNPRALLRSYLDRLAPGSYLALSHAAVDEATPLAREQYLNLEREYGSTSNPVYVRRRDEFTELFDGLDIVEPGVVYATDWRNVQPVDPHSPGRPCLYAAVGRKP